jgi:hypothetical protein
VGSPLSGSLELQIDGFGPTLRHTFDLPGAAPAASQLLRRVAERYRGLDSVLFLEHLASSPSHAVTSLWRLERPDRVSYTIPGGAQGIIIGAQRWDRGSPDARWRRSAQTPLSQPAAPWASATNAHLIADSGETKTITFVDPTTPAYFELTVDAKTLLPRAMHMTASAHFMTDRYVRFNAERAIFPPR